MLDAFNSDNFGLVSLSSSLDKLPSKPARIQKLGLFESEGVTQRTIVLEEYNGVLALLPTKPWGAPPSIVEPEKRTARSFSITHVPHEGNIMAGDVQGVRAFGDEAAPQVLAKIVNRKLRKMKRSHEVTLEHLMAGALRGNILDSDGSTVIYNLFTEYDVSPTTEAFLLASETTTAREHCLNVSDAIETALGSASYDHIHAFCGKTWFKKFIKNADVKAGYARWRDGELLRNDPRAGFPFGGIIFESYAPTVGGVAFFADAEARFFPVGVDELFKVFFAPAEFMETVNTIGQQYYAKMEALPMNRGQKIATESNPLPVCTIPAVLIKGSTD